MKNPCDVFSLERGWITGLTRTPSLLDIFLVVRERMFNR